MKIKKYDWTILYGMIWKNQNVANQFDVEWRQ